MPRSRQEALEGSHSPCGFMRQPCTFLSVVARRDPNNQTTKPILCAAPKSRQTTLRQQLRDCDVSNLSTIGALSSS